MKQYAWEDDFELDPEWDFVLPAEALLFEQYAESDWWTRKNKN